MQVNSANIVTTSWCVEHWQLVWSNQHVCSALLCSVRNRSCCCKGNWIVKHLVGHDLALVVSQHFPFAVASIQTYVTFTIYHVNTLVCSVRTVMYMSLCTLCTVYMSLCTDTVCTCHYVQYVHVIMYIMCDNWHCTVLYYVCTC